MGKTQLKVFKSFKQGTLGLGAILMMLSGLGVIGSAAYADGSATSTTGSATGSTTNVPTSASNILQKSNTGTTTVTGTLPVFNGTFANITVYKEGSYGTLSDPVPAIISQTVVATDTVTSPSFSFVIPTDPGGNYKIVAVADNETSSTYMTNPITTPLSEENSTNDTVTPSSDIAYGSSALHVTALPWTTFPASDHLAGVAQPAAGPPCQDMRIGTSYQESRLGELHVAAVAGMEGTYTYVDQADSKLSLGASYTDGGFSYGGTITVENKIGSTASVPRGDGFIKYIDGHIYYGKFEENRPGCGSPYTTHATTAQGDVYQGANTPRPNPWKYCYDAPSHAAYVSKDGGTFDSDRSTATYYAVVAKAFGFSFGGNTGYTNGINISYKNNSNTVTSVCGKGSNVNDSPTLYNDLQ
jgi:hypothetical protein